MSPAMLTDVAAVLAVERAAYEGARERELRSLGASRKLRSLTRVEKDMMGEETGRGRRQEGRGRRQRGI